MPIGQFVRKPVTLYKSTDDGAPQLAATPGSLKTILEACLVSGYGSKQSLGWEMPFSDANSAVFKSKAPDSTGCCLQVLNTGARFADVRGYRSMTSLTQGEGAFGHQQNRRYPTLYYNVNTTPWALIGHDKAFWLFLHDSNYRDGSLPLFFGDFCSYASADKGNCGIFNLWSSPNTEYINNSIPSQWNVRDNNSHAFHAACSWDGLTESVPLRCNSRCLWYAGQQYPDPITGGLQADMMDLHEEATARGKVLRGRLPGAYYCAHDLRSIGELTEVDGFDGTDDRFIKVRLDTYSSSRDINHYLINTTAWLA